MSKRSKTTRRLITKSTSDSFSFFKDLLLISIEGTDFDIDFEKLEVLEEYTFENGEKILSESNKSFIDNIISMLLSPGEFDDKLYQVKNYLKNVRVKSDIFNIPLFDRSREEMVKLKSLENWKPTGSKYAGKCKKCGNSNVIFANINERSLDEGAVTNYRCIDCDYTWKNRG